MEILKTKTVTRNAIDDPEMGGWVETYNISLVKISNNVELLIYHLEDKTFIDSHINSVFFQENIEYYSKDVNYNRY